MVSLSLRLLTCSALVALLPTAANSQSPDAPVAPAAATPAATAPSDPSTDPADKGWPREFQANGHDVRLYTPEVDQWPKFNRITFRAAVSVAPSGTEDRTYGIIRVSADTKISMEDRLVVLTNRKLEDLTFAGVDPAESARLFDIVLAATPPAKPQTVSLDRLIATMNPATVDIRKVSVATAPPRIFTSESPAVLVIFMGRPRFKPVPNSDLLFAINTNWDIFLDPTAQQYYLRNGNSWLTAQDIEHGTWTQATSLPPSLSSLPANENWADVQAAIPGAPADVIPLVFVSRLPAELVVTSGPPEMEPVPGTRLMLVANTDSDLFYHSTEQRYYLLSAGRWFKAPALVGPWSAASDSLPDDFRKIPPNPYNADVLASIPGTPAASEAMIMASVPQTATINRADLTLNVTYDGPPDFRLIPSTSVQSAYNSPFNVFRVDSKFYCCSNAVWFTAPTPTGPWVVCDAVPDAIYTIPPTNPNYNVTYVSVYDSTPTTVVTGYTGGYTGETVATTGVVMFGLGLLVGAALDDDCCWSYHYPACYFSYGCGAVWHGGYGGYICGVSHYGPYGGAGRVAVYNPSTGVYSRAGFAYGPNGAAGYRTAYNPATGVAAGRVGGATPYGSWSRGVVTNGDQWLRGGQRSTANGTVGAIQGSGGAGAVTVQGRYGNGTTVAKSQSGDYYAARDGNVYKKSDDGWQQAGNRADAQSTRQPSAEYQQQLSQQAAARASGDFNAQRAQQSWGGGQSYGSGSRGGYRGGGRRR